MSQQVTVFGANGKIGSLVVAEALHRGYNVVAFVHHIVTLEQTDHLTIIQGDIYNPDEVAAALTGSDFVISALGSWGTPKKDILTIGMGHIIAGMQQHAISTVISLTGADARASGDTLGMLHRMMHVMIKVFANKILIDGERHIALLEQSQLDWTVVRSSIMSSQVQINSSYVFTNQRPGPWQIISRRLVVVSMVDTLQDRTWKQRAPFISRG